ncbi:kinase-like protein [Aureobasidium namibiae CBS 147.97]|uniref:EKC/KEOPS complex subunit BUD32 n=1 Tax=Aureobasidium namibiae CBS 147.97 TaxID=1043004 RepID=A0A074WTI9_9PEZI|nr:kinase-like protein [Aureobasidium namibiae CBS 147.97]KEQ76520.1 kinase-like protein [Aureobasidium namibiae CBS 147.97]
MVRPRHPTPLYPGLDRRAYGGLRHGAQDKLIDRFLRWTFRRPPRAKPGRALHEGEWLPMQPDYNQGEQPLGEGGMGIVHLWCYIDNNNRIRDRVIVKQVHPGVFSWERKDMWRDGEVGGEPREHMLSNKVYENLEASTAGHGKFMTECLGYGSIRDPNLNIDWTTGLMAPSAIAGYKLYFEYCPFGDLRNAIIRQSNAGEFFHEGFIWMVFEALAECAVAMTKDPIVHMDITTSNVLLSNNDPQRFKIWPTPKLSDFGSARIINSSTARRRGPVEAMHPYFTPPELGVMRGDWEVDGLKVSHRTNVWQIGLVITCMMRLEFYLPETDWRTGPSSIHPNDELHFHDPNQRELHPHSFQHANCNYSPNLLALVRQCMRYDPARRPSPRALLQRIQARIPGSCGGMDTYTGDRNGSIPWNKTEKLRGLKKDNEWPLGDDAEVVDVF